MKSALLRLWESARAFVGFLAAALALVASGFALGWRKRGSVERAKQAQLYASWENRRASAWRHGDDEVKTRIHKLETLHPRMPDNPRVDSRNLAARLDGLAAEWERYGQRREKPAGGAD